MLTPQDIDAVALAGESLRVEFKGEAKHPLSDDDLVAAVVCLANGPGGLIFVGIEADPVAAVVPSATWHDLDPLEIERLRRFVQEAGRGDTSLAELSDIDLCKSLGAVEGNGQVSGVRQLGLLLFGREAALRRLMPTHEVAWQVLEGTSVLANDILRWPLLRVVEEVTARFRARNRTQELVDVFRTEVPDYSPEGFREALVNALVHREYAMLGAVHVQWHSEHIRIDSPGGFPEGVRRDNLLVTQPRPRNLSLADAFKRAGLVERTGRGVDTIFAGQLRYGRPAPDYGLSTEVGVTVVLRGGPANLKLAGFLAAEGRAGRAVELADLLVMDYLTRARSITTGVVAELAQCNESSAGALASRMVKLGWLMPSEDRKVGSYLLSATLRDALGAAVTFVRAKGPSPTQHVRRVLQFAKERGQITRSDVSDLCGVSLDQASRILSGIAKTNNNFVREGKGRGARYRLVRGGESL